MQNHNDDLESMGSGKWHYAWLIKVDSPVLLSPFCRVDWKESIQIVRSKQQGHKKGNSHCMRRQGGRWNNRPWSEGYGQNMIRGGLNWILTDPLLKPQTGKCGDDCKECVLSVGQRIQLCASRCSKDCRGSRAASTPDQTICKVGCHWDRVCFLLFHRALPRKTVHRSWWCTARRRHNLLQFFSEWRTSKV